MLFCSIFYILCIQKNSWDILLNPHIYITYSIHTQSRSSPYAEYASCEGLPKHQGAPLPLKDEFWILNFACGYENMNDHLFKMRCAVTSSDPRLLGSLRRTGWGLKWKNGCNAVVCVLLRLESQSRKALISSAAPYAFNYFFFSSKRLNDIHVTWFDRFLSREGDSTPH